MVSTPPAPASPAAPSNLLLEGRNSVLEPEKSRTGALAGQITAMGNVPVGSSTEVRLCRTATELSRALETNVGIGASVGPLPLVGLRRSFQQSLHTTSFSLSIVVKASRIVDGFEVVNPQLKSDRALPGTPQELDRFVDLHGDSWVRGVQRGAEMQLVFTLYAQTSQESEAAAQNIQAIVPIQGLLFTPELGQKIVEVSKSSGLNVSAKFHVLGVAQPALNSAEQWLAFISNFGSLPIQSPVPLAIDCRGYEEIEALQDIFKPVQANRLLFLGDPAFPTNPGLLRRQQHLQAIANQCRWVEETYTLYGQEPDPTLNTNTTLIQKDLDAIDALRAAYGKSASTPLQEPPLAALDLGSPRLAPEIRNGPSLGGDGGEVFEYTNPFNAIARRRRLAMIGMRSGSAIDQIRLAYTEDADKLSTGAEAQESGKPHGGGGGSDRGNLMLNLDNNEQITTINANTGTRVDALEFMTNVGRSLSGGKPSPGGKATPWNVGPNQVVLGFQGRSGSRIDALQAVLADFSNALKWVEVPQDQH